MSLSIIILDMYLPVHRSQQQAFSQLKKLKPVCPGQRYIAIVTPALHLFLHGAFHTMVQDVDTASLQLGTVSPAAD